MARFGYRSLFLALGLIAAPLAVVAAVPNNIVSGNPGIFDGSAINGIYDYLRGNSSGTYVGTFNGTLGATTPNTAAVTTLNASGAAVLSSTLAVTGATTPTGGIAASGGFSIAPNLVHTGAWKPLAITDGSSVTCTNTTTYVAQLFVPANATITGVAIVNAAAVAGNITVGLADSTGAPITAAQSASTAQSGTAAYQRIPFASPYAATGPATYYLQLQCSNGSATFRAHTVGDFRTTTQTSGTYGTIIAFTPPTTFTTAVGPVASLY